AFLALQYIDDAAPNYPLTPKKYWYIVPITAFAVADFVLLWLFFGAIQPDKIVTCCSVNFVGTTQNTWEFLGTSQTILPLIAVWILLAIVLLGLLQKNNQHFYLQFFLAALYTTLGIYTLKYFFVKYIYGLASHYCLYDTLLSNYYCIGFLLFGGYFVLLFNIVVMTIIYKNRQKLTYEFTKETQMLKKVNIAILLANTTIPILYWLFWRGDL
ncbi:MAG: hypothetical protein ACOVQA_11685, partial [Thermoflexibacteraceae bacterium]